MAKFYSAIEGGFFDDAIHAALPSDAVALDPATYDQLIADQGAGKMIVASGDGTPIAQDPPVPPPETQREITARQIKLEAERRMSELAEMRAEINALRRIVVDGTAATQEQIDRWAYFDAIEGDAAQAKADLDADPDPASFDPYDDNRWTQTP